MNGILYCVLGGVVIAGLLADIIMMSRVRLARAGNLIGAAAVLLIVVVTLFKFELVDSVLLLSALVIGVLLGIIGACRVKMIEMPQTVALLNGLGGLASACVAWSALSTSSIFECHAALLALATGVLTFTGSLVATGKLARILPQRPVVIYGHGLISAVLLLATVVGVGFRLPILTLVAPAVFGVIFSIRVGGADMPITISLLNSLSGVAGGISGIAIGDPVLACAGGVVGASGLLLTQIMCRAMNRHLTGILFPCGMNAAVPAADSMDGGSVVSGKTVQLDENTLASALTSASDVIIVPGYGMALAQAQGSVKKLADRLESRGVRVRYAIHPVAGRMPGHMNVLLCEVDVPYEQLFELEAINDDFKKCDVAIVVGANDTINPAANTAEGTPIYGMPVLAVDEAPHVVICNLDTKPGYAGVPNAIYDRSNVMLIPGDANAGLEKLLKMLE